MGSLAASPPLASEGGYPSLYCPRNVRATALYQLLESYYEQVKALWEDRFEKKYGFWRGFVDSVVARYLDCGTVEAGFARLRCEACGSERLLTLSCKQRGICPSCDAKRAAQLQRVLEDRAHGDTLRADLQQGLPTLPTWMQSVVREVLDAKVKTARRSRSRRRGDQINAG